jgi:ATP-dependent protease ClpP protease subunit
MTKELLQELCIAKRIFPLNGRIENGMVTDLEKALFQMYLENDKKPAHIIIDSGGGSVRPALNIHDFIKGLPFDVNCTVIGDCHSAALLILAACVKRKSTIHSRFLFHAMRTEDEILSTKDVERQVREIKEKQMIVFQQGLTLQSKAFGIPEEELQQIMREGQEFDIKLTAQQALQKGVIHEIVEKFDFMSAVA